jgi:hypothetical protein
VLGRGSGAEALVREGPRPAEGRGDQGLDLDLDPDAFSHGSARAMPWGRMTLSDAHEAPLTGDHGL